MDSSINCLFAVFDGHNGFQASQFCKQNLIKKVESIVKIQNESISFPVSWDQEQEQLTKFFTEGKKVYNLHDDKF